ncbi:MAG: tRNA pseudouridine(38-40) synthase TruA [Candidatus Thorarchaeota archaeon]
MGAYLGRVFYLGTQYYGSQWQPGVRTVQMELINAISKWSGELHTHETVVLSGRTDRGVHSIGQIILVQTEKRFDIDRINKYLPDDIVIWAYADAPEGFHPRYSILMRHYRYYLSEMKELDLCSIRKALQGFVGSHDYSQLSKPDGDRGTFATILNANVTDHDGSLSFDFFGTSFLWKLVRKTVALMVRIGQGEFSPDIVTDLLQGKTTVAGGINPAPPEGLVLVESVVPIRMITSKYALGRIRSQVGTHLIFLHRTVRTLSAVASDFFSDQMFPF